MFILKGVLVFSSKIRVEYGLVSENISFKNRYSVKHDCILAFSISFTSLCMILLIYSNQYGKDFNKSFSNKFLTLCIGIKF